MAGFFPMFVRLAGRIVVVVGGGEVALRTVEALLACDAEVRLISPRLAPGFGRLRGRANLTRIGRRLETGDLEDALIALAVDDDPAINLAVARLGLECNVLVSVADELSLSDFVVPSFVHRGGLTLAMHSPTLSTALARRIGEDLEQALGPEYGDFMAVLERARGRIAGEVADPEEQRLLFDQLLRSDLLQVIQRDGLEAADKRVEALLDGNRRTR